MEPGGPGKERRPISWGKFIYIGCLLFILSWGMKWIFLKTFYIEGLGVLDTEVTEVEAKFPGRILNIKHKINDSVTTNEPIVFLDRSELELKLQKLRQNQTEKIFKAKNSLLVLIGNNEVLEKQIHDNKLVVEALQSDYLKIEALVSANTVSTASIPSNLDKAVQWTLEISKLNEEQGALKQEIKNDEVTIIELKRELERIKHLVSRNVLTRSHLRSIELEIKEKQDEISLKNIKNYSLGQKRNVRDTEIRSLIEFETQKIQKTISLLLIKNKYTLKEIQTLEFEISELKASFAKEKEKLQQFLENSVIFSPLNGLVLAIKKQKGESVKLGESVMVIGDKSKLHLKAFFEQDQRNNILLGDKVDIIFASGEKGRGEITKIYPMALPWPLEYEGKFGNPGRFITVKITFDHRENIPETLKTKAQVRVQRIY